MMMRSLLAGFALVALVATTGCEGQGVAGMGRQETIGTGVGAAAGGLAGYLITGGPIGTIVGVAAGGLIGNRIGNWLDVNHQQSAAETVARAAEVPTGQRVSWQRRDILGNPTASGWASPTANARRAADGRLCRRIHEEATQDRQTRSDNITVCKNTSGAWVPA